MNVSNANPGKLVVDHHEPLVSRIKPYGELVAVYMTTFPRGWVYQALHIPITVGKNSRILLRVDGLVDDDCIGLQQELAGLAHLKRSRTVSPPPSPLKRQRLVTPLLESLVPPAPSVTPPTFAATATAVTMSTSQFPLLYTCDMAKGLKLLLRVTSEKELSHKFRDAFPGCLFVVKTVRHHRLIYIRAQELGLLSRYITHGRTPAGHWSELRKVTDARWRELRSFRKYSFL